MKELTIIKAVISDSKVLVSLDYPIKNDVAKVSDYNHTIIDKANRIIKNSFYGNYSLNTNKINKMNNKTNNNMNTVNNNTNNNTKNIKRRTKVRTIPLSLREAKQWYKSNNDTLKRLALKVFTEEELVDSFVDIKSFKDACAVLNLDYTNTQFRAAAIAEISKASAAMFKLNIVKRALNFGQDLHLTKDPKDSHIYAPFNPIMTTDSSYYKKELEANKIEIIGSIKYEGISYKVLSSTGYYSNPGLGCFISDIRVGLAEGNSAFLGCATKEIAKHFSKYFGMLITEAKYGDLPNFEIVDQKYNI
nr:MAG TPA: hypothetical protein [Crassvirales sp.]